MFLITKSHYCDFVYCPRCFYYSMVNPDKAKPIDEHTNAIIQKGILVGQVAHKYFPNTNRVIGVGDKPNIEFQLETTKKYIDAKVDVIAEASFKVGDLYCAVDLLKRNGDGYDIYEVKASGKNIKNEYYPDVAFQKYVLTKCGIKINRCYLLHLNELYVRHGEIEVNKLLTPYPIDKDIKFSVYYDDIDANLDDMRRLINNKSLPDYGEGCTSDCAFKDWCHHDLPTYNVTTICGIRKKKAHELIRSGIITYEDAIKKGITVSNNLRKSIQMKVCMSGLSRWFDKDRLLKFLHSLKYPLYHLDFETYSEAIPPFDGAHPYQTVPFQYSLHIEHSLGGKCDHREFLAEKYNAMYELAKQLCEDIPLNATTIAFHASTEMNIMRDLANRFPDLHDHLMNIVYHTVDLIEPFKQGYFYDAKQMGSNSIKLVMPALCPHMENAYHELPFVHNGGEAMNAFPRLMEMEHNQEYQEKRQGMLSYCCLDTLSMVEILKVLWDSVK